MHTNGWTEIIRGLVIAASATLFTGNALASDDHQASRFHRFDLEMVAGENRDGAISRWDLDGWWGNDEHKLWLRDEGERADSRTESRESWFLYSRNTAPFWDLQAGVRHDGQPDTIDYLALGVQGLAPYRLETAAHWFVSDEGDSSFRLRIGTDLQLTQKQILHGYIETNAFLRDVVEQGRGSGISDIEVSLQWRYAITRKLMPGIDIRYERLFGKTARYASDNDERSRNASVAFGLWLMF